jgi:hypothetical protein
VVAAALLLLYELLFPGHIQSMFGINER